ELADAKASRIEQLEERAVPEIRGLTTADPVQEREGLVHGEILREELWPLRRGDARRGARLDLAHPHRMLQERAHRGELPRRGALRDPGAVQPRDEHTKLQRLDRRGARYLAPLLGEIGSELLEVRGVRAERLARDVPLVP